MLTPLRTAEVIELRTDSRSKQIEHLKSRIRRHESELSKHAQEIRWAKLELESLGVVLPL